MAISLALRQLEITHKNKGLQTPEPDLPEVKQRMRSSRKKLKTTDPKQLLSIDKSGANTAMPRTYGHAAANQRIHG